MTPRVLSPLPTSLVDLSCVSASFCEGAGSYFDDSQELGASVAQRWNGSGWRLQLPPSPGLRVAQNTGLSGVACVSASLCMAVGSYQDSVGTSLPLAEHWSGQRWQVLRAALPRPTYGAQLNGVACPSVTVCMAVGFNDTSHRTSVPLAERWDGTAWSAVAVPVPTGAAQTQLNGVACVSATDCTAVGFSQTAGSRPRPLAAAWDGHSFTLQAAALPAGAVSAQLARVSCPSGTVCTAVGSYQSSAGTRPLAEQRNGTAWQVQAVPEPATAKNGQLDGISCPSTSACEAVGYYTSASSRPANLSELWTGRSWTQQPAPAPPNSYGSQLSAVSCVSAADCTTMGTYRNDLGATGITLAEHWDGQRWAIQPTTDPQTYPYQPMLAVSCASTTSCTGVGYFLTSTCCGNPVPFSEQWANGRWVRTLSAHSDATGEILDVACPAVTFCPAVGWYYSRSGQQLFAEAWDGHRWATQNTAQPPAQFSSSLSGIACVSTSACMAVGGYSDTSGNQYPIAERWDGSRWTLLPVPQPANLSGGGLNGVACPSATDCLAVGSTYSHVIAAHWNGTRWTAAQAPTPGGAQQAQLNALACTSATSCLAVGTYTLANSSSQVPLVEQWNGNHWDLSSAPQTAQGVSLQAVSCPAAHTCVAAGNPGAIIQQWNGTTWSAQPVPLPKGSTGGDLHGVSCLSPALCTAVGDFSVNAGTFSLAERYS